MGCTRMARGASTSSLTRPFGLHLAPTVLRHRSVVLSPMSFHHAPTPLLCAAQYMTHRNRWGRLERAAQLYNRMQSERVSQLLSSMAFKVQQSLQAASRKVVEVLRRLQDLGISDQQVRFE